jgi:DNA-binding FadR family transcriptional regulator
MQLQPIVRREAAHTAADHALRSAILAGDLAPGARLPPERELAGTLGVSRLTLRAALATLVADGLVSVHHGRGYEVRDFRTGGTALLPGLVELAAARGGLPAITRDLLRVRRHLAAAVLEALAEHPPGAGAVRRVADAVAAFAGQVEAGAAIDALAAADLAVTAALLDATGSPVLRLCLNPIVDVVARDHALRAALYVDPPSNVAAYQLLLAWLERPRRQTAADLVAIVASRDAATVDRIARAAAGRPPPRPTRGRGTPRRRRSR